MSRNMSVDLLMQYIDHALTFERMADAEPNRALKADLERQAFAYRGLAAQHARRLGLPLPSEPERCRSEGLVGGGINGQRIRAPVWRKA
jgi:hypothetical protein